MKASYPFSASNLSQIQWRFVLPQNVHDLEASIRRFIRRIVACISKTIRVFTNKSYTNEKLWETGFSMIVRWLAPDRYTLDTSRYPEGSTYVSFHEGLWSRAGVLLLTRDRGDRDESNFSAENDRAKETSPEPSIIHRTPQPILCPVDLEIHLDKPFDTDYTEIWPKISAKDVRSSAIPWFDIANERKVQSLGSVESSKVERARVETSQSQISLSR